MPLNPEDTGAAALLSLDGIEIEDTPSGSSVLRAKTGPLASGGLLLNNQIVPPRAIDRRFIVSLRPLSTTEGNNRDSRNQPIPLILGEHRFFPPYIGTEYLSKGGEDTQTIHQIFCWGIGNIEVSDRRVGAASVSDYSDFESEFLTGAAGNDSSTIYTTNSQILGTNLVFDRPLNDPYRFELDDPDPLAVEIDWSIRSFNFIPSLNLYLSANFVYVLDVDDIARPGQTLPFVIVNRGVKAVNSFDVFSNRHDIRPGFFGPIGAFQLGWGGLNIAARGLGRNNPSLDLLTVQDATVLSIRAIYRDEPVPDINREATRVLATGQFNGRLDTFNGLVRQIIPFYDAATSTWVSPPEWDNRMRNPAAVYRFFGRGVFGRDGSLIVGAGYPLTDDDALANWHQFCESNAYACDLVVENDASSEDILTSIAACGRATPHLENDTLSVIADRPDSNPSFLACQPNMVADSYTCEYLSERTPTDVVGTYYDRDDDFNLATARAISTIPGVSRGTSTMRIDGVTTRRHAEQLVSLQRSANEELTLRHTWRTDVRGTDYRRGDTINIAPPLFHPSGRFVGWSPFIGSPTLTNLFVFGAVPSRPSTSGPIRAGGETSGLLYVHGPGGGSGTQPNAVLRFPVAVFSVDGDITRLVAPTSSLPRPFNDLDTIPGDPSDWVWAQSFDDLPRAKITSIRHLEENLVEISARNDPMEHYSATSSRSTRRSAVRRLSTPRITGHTLNQEWAFVGGRYVLQLSLAWGFSGPYHRARVLIQLPGRTREVISAPFAARADWQEFYSDFNPGTASITVTPSSERSRNGVPYTIPFELRPFDLVPDDPETLTITERGIGRLLFDAAGSFLTAPDHKGACLRFSQTEGAAWEDMTPVFEGAAPILPVRIELPHAGGLIFFRVKSVNLAGIESDGTAQATFLASGVGSFGHDFVFHGGNFPRDASQDAGTVPDWRVNQSFAGVAPGQLLPLPGETTETATGVVVPGPWLVPQQENLTWNSYADWESWPQWGFLSTPGPDVFDLITDPILLGGNESYTLNGVEFFTRTVEAPSPEGSLIDRRFNANSALDFALTVANSTPRGIASDATRIYVGDLTNASVFVYQTDGTFLFSIPLRASGVSNPTRMSLTVEPGQGLWVSHQGGSFSNWRIQFLPFPLVDSVTPPAVDARSISPDDINQDDDDLTVIDPWRSISWLDGLIYILASVNDNIDIVAINPATKRVSQDFQFNFDNIPGINGLDVDFISMQTAFDQAFLILDDEIRLQSPTAENVPSRFSIPSANGDPRGFDINGTDTKILDGSDRRVYGYTLSGGSVSPSTEDPSTYLSVATAHHSIQPADTDQTPLSFAPLSDGDSFTGTGFRIRLRFTLTLSPDRRPVLFALSHLRYNLTFT